MKRADAGVEWRDLVPITRREVFNELALSAPWLVGSVYCYRRGWIVAGAACSFYLFLAGLRQSHGAQHYSLGISRRAHEWVLFGLSVLMMGSMHAVQVSHMNHHRHCLEEEDAEGNVARLRWWEALLSGPLFAGGLLRCAWAKGSPASRRWIVAEMLGVVLLTMVAWIGFLPVALACHLSAMLLGECFTGFFAVWIVHHDCEDSAGRTQRGAWLNWISYNMLFHREHHLYPATPTGHLDELARRLDLRCETTARKQVVGYSRRRRVARRRVFLKFEKEKMPNQLETEQ
jgi:fatty acid desaturase